MRTEDPGRKSPVGETDDRRSNPLSGDRKIKARTAVRNEDKQIKAGQTRHAGDKLPVHARPEQHHLEF
jgi:hypothetical protein